MLRPSNSSDDRKPDTNEILHTLDLWPEEQEVIASIAKQYDMEADLKPDHLLKTEHVGPVLRIAKELRNCSVHRFGRKTAELEKLAKRLPFEQFLVPRYFPWLRTEGILSLPATK